MNNRTNLNRNLAIVFCCLALFTSGLALSLSGILLPGISFSFQLSTWESGIFLSFNFAGYMTLLIIGGILAEKIGKKQTISIAIVGALIAALSIVWSNGLWQAAAMTFLLAGCAGILESMGCALISEINPSRSHFLVNLAMGSMAVGYLSAALFSSAFLSLGLNWRMVYAAVILILMLDFIFLHTAKLDNKKETAKKFFIQEKKTIWLNQYFILGCICMLLYTGIEVTFFSWLTTYFVLEVKVVHAVSLLIVGFFYFSMVLGRIIYGFLIRRFKAVNIAVLSCLVTAPLIIAVMHAGISGPIYLAIFLLGISFSGISPFIIAATGQIGSRDSSYSVIMGSGGIGTIIIPALVGFTGDLINISTAISCLAPLMVLIACILQFGIKQNLELGVDKIGSQSVPIITIEKKQKW